MRRVAMIAGALALATAPVFAEPVVAAFERFHARDSGSSPSVAGGLLLLNELNCVACHAAPPGWRERLPGRGRIALAGIGARLPAVPLARFIADPAGLKPGTTMPRLAGDAAEARAIAAHLQTITAPAPAETPVAGNAKHGERLYASIGCAACHAPPGAAETFYASVPIGLAAHYERAPLIAFLRDPLRTRPAGRMPAFALKDAEAADLAAYLQVGRVPDPLSAEGHGPKPGRVADPPYVERGRARYAALNCAACHDTDAATGARIANPVTPLARARAGAGCLAPQPPGGVPDFSLSEPQRQAIAAALRDIASHPAPPADGAEERVAATFERLNCYACHEWRGRGGPEPARARYFTATDSAIESLGDLGHLPPRLDPAGRKLTPAWLARLLWGEGGGVRPYMTARMPRFGEPAAGELVGCLAEACRPRDPQEIDTSGGKGHQRFATGRALLGTGTGGLGCVACHGLKDSEPAGVHAINLTHTAARVQPEYFKALLLDPQGIQPGTIMPPLLAGRKDAGKEVESMWTYFKELDQSNVLPEGLARPGSFELKPAVERRPIVFRTFLVGAGTQAIAVGYPAGVNAAFDAYEVRWALAWRGRFLDAQTNWEERPMKPIKPLDAHVRSWPTHMPLAVLHDPAEPWPTRFGAYAGYVFKGYRLAADGTPTFRYAIGGLEVEDTLRPSPDGAGLLRRVVVRRATPGDGTWYFRGLGAGVMPQPLAWRDGVAVVEETISP